MDLILATWNVRTLKRPGALHALKRQLELYRVEIAAIQEMRWPGNGILESGDWTVFFSGSNDGSGMAGTGFLVNRKRKEAVIGFKPVNERISTLRLRSQFFNITLVCVYAPTEDADEEEKERFYEKLEEVVDEIAHHDVKILLGDLNAKIGREERFQSVIGKESLHSESNDNGRRVIDLAVRKDMIISSTQKQRKNIKKATWCSPDGVTSNQIDHILIDKRHCTDITNVESCRGADINSDHYMVRIGCRQRITVTNNKRAKTQARFDVAKLKEEAVSHRYEECLKNYLEQKEDAWNTEGVEGKWSILKESVIGAAREVVGSRKKEIQARWFDEECITAIERRNRARMKMIQRKTRGTVEDYRSERRIADKLCRRKKRAYEKQQLESIKEHYGRGEMRKFYKKIREDKKGFQPRAVYCKDKLGNMIGDEQGIKRRWREHFDEVLNHGQQETETAYDDVRTVQEEVGRPMLNEVKEAIKDLANNKAPGLDLITAELVKKGGDMFVQRMHALINEIWLEEKMPEEWSIGIICPVHKKGDKMEC
ncbi:craniofacial development protein 2-like [Nilaparvata lugens]|uniref:craniofacial development protein 2-like n=1 Tax=Nilaparvata lugens TaxID=108931 RepID=UPI00193E2D32|nr:craniofacial development protein 2-like [Nilaparvata lugens]